MQIPFAGRRGVWRFWVVVAALATACASSYRPVVRFHEEVLPSLPSGKAMPVDIPRAQLRVAVDPRPFLTESDVVAASLVPTAGGMAIRLVFDTHGRMALEEATTRARGDHIVVFIDGRPVGAWLVEHPLVKGEFLVEGDFTDEEARKFVKALGELAKETHSP